jgi:hypothetical protein
MLQMVKKVKGRGQKAEDGREVGLVLLLSSVGADWDEGSASDKSKMCESIRSQGLTTCRKVEG